MIEITRKKSAYIYRINMYAPTEIDRRANRHNARWTRHSRYATAELARAALFELEKSDESETGAS